MLSFDKQTVTHSGLNFDPSILDELIKNMGSVSGVLHVVPSDFVRRVRFVPEDGDNGVSGCDDSTRDYHPLRLNDSTTVDAFAAYDKSNVYLRIVNKSPQPIGQFAFAVNSNSIGLTVSGQPMFPAQLDSGDICEVTIPIKINPAAANNFENPNLQIALRTNNGTIFALDNIPAQVATVSQGNIGQDEFKQLFAQYSASFQTVVDDASVSKDDYLLKNNIFVVGKNENRTYISFAFSPSAIFVGELTQNGQSVNVSIKGANQTFFPVIQNAARDMFTHDEIRLI